jgi:hypothetical protein
MTPESTMLLFHRRYMRLYKKIHLLQGSEDVRRNNERAEEV